MTEAEQLAKVKEFAREVLFASWDGSTDVNGGDIQDLAERFGLIKIREATKEDEAAHPDICEGDNMCEFEDWMQPTRATP